MQRKVFILIFIVFITKLMSFSQNNHDKNLLEIALPVEPTTASLGKYGVFPVDYSTGLVPIKIPLFVIKNGDIEQPIELSYHGGGIKVAEESTWVGLGWNLNWGGIITRTMNGFPDEEEITPVPDANIIRAQMVANHNTTNNLIDYDNLNKARTPDLSSKPDLYHYNFGNYAGTFIIVNSVIRPISYNAVTGTLNNVVAPDGTTYKFSVSENTVLIRKLMPQKNYGSGFYIDKIISPNKTDTISYTYQPDGVYTAILQSFYQGLVSTKARPLVLGNPSPSPVQEHDIQVLPLSNEQVTTQKVNSKKPEYIVFSGGRVTFNLGERLDIPGLKKLDNIVIEKKEGSAYSVVKAIKFYYSYFNSAGNVDYIRLCLDSVAEFPSLQSVEKKLIAKFEYYGNKSLPSKKSYASDFWGFYNGKSNNSPIPTTSFPPYTFGSADKNPDENYAQYGTIKSIAYPTKGKTEFIWEGNKINYNSVPGSSPFVKKDAMLFFNPVSDVLCSNSPAPLLTKSITIHSYIDQPIVINYYLYQKDILDPIHKRRDKGEITFNDQILTNYLSRDASPKKIYIRLAKNEDYTFTIKTNCSNVEGSVWFSYNGYNPNADANIAYPFAGIRIREIKNYDTDNKLLTQKKYEYVDPSGKSSGILTHNKPISYYKRTTLFDEGSEGNSIYSYTIEKDLVYSNQYSGMEADNFMYEYVKEFHVDYSQNNAEGYTIYQFSKASDRFYNADIPIINQSHLRGRLINQRDYKRTATGFELVRETQNEYTQDNRISYKAKGFAMSQNYEFTSPIALVHGLNWSSIDQTLIFDPVNYEYSCDWIYLKKSTVRDYTAPATFTNTVTEYLYNNLKHLQPNEIKITTSTEDIQKIRILYPSDINTGIFIEMTNNNMLTYPVDTKKYILRTGQADKLIDGEYNLYEKNSYNHIILKKVSEYLPSGALNDLFEYKYNAKGRVVEVIGTDRVPQSIYWDALNIYPIVRAKNMSYETLSNAVKTNFSPFTFPTSPVCAGAQVTTYTYKPLVGMTSKTNPNGVTTYYEYDLFGRLKYVKDHNGKIIEQYDYHYKP